VVNEEEEEQERLLAMEEERKLNETTKRKLEVSYEVCWFILEVGSVYVPSLFFKSPSASDSVKRSILFYLHRKRSDWRI